MLASTILTVAVIAPAACSLTTEGADYVPASSTSAQTSTTSSTSEGGGTTTQSGSGGEGGVASGTGGTGGAPLPENCTNGADDDLDGASDCKDQMDCGAEVTCESEAPTGWKGYFRILRKPYEMQAAPPACPDGSPPISYFAGPAGPAQCAQCGCTWPDASCTAPKIECFASTASCANGADLTETASNDTCIPKPGFSPGGSDESCKLTGSPVITNANVCMTSGGQFQNPLPWGEDVFVCGGPTTAGGCDPGQACVPIDIGTYLDRLCIQKDGSDACPEGWKAEDLQVYGGADDKRSCTPCSCTSDASCNADGFYTVYDEDNCTGSNTKIATQNCTPVSDELGPSGSLKPSPATVKPGTCGGSEAQGALTPMGAKKICCR